MLSLSAATLRDVPRIEAIESAANAGFAAIGLRLDIDPPTPAGLVSLRSTLATSGLRVLDVEVARLSEYWDLELEQRLIDQAAELGAAHLLVVSDDPDRSRTLDGLARVAANSRSAGLTAVLEFMNFTHPRNLRDAVALTAEVGPALGGVVVDALHLQRSGSSPSELSQFEPALFPYAQLCDAPAVATDTSTDALIWEARHGRVLPGEGELPLHELIAALPRDAALSIEVQSDALERTLSAQERAARCHWAVTALL
jgi:sugar phosphate isomerase/epimerase